MRVYVLTIHQRLSSRAPLVLVFPHRFRVADVAPRIERQLERASPRHAFPRATVFAEVIGDERYLARILDRLELGAGDGDPWPIAEHVTEGAELSLQLVELGETGA